MLSEQWKKGEIPFIDRNPYPERLFTGISVFLSVVSVALTGWSVASSVPSWIVLVKDLTIFFTLLILVLFFFVRYRMVLSSKREMQMGLDKELSALRDMINIQLDIYHKLMSRTRESMESVYYESKDKIYPHRFNYKNKELKELLNSSLSNIIASMVEIINNHIQIKFGKIKEEITFSVKAVVTGEMALSICKNLTDKQKIKISPDDDCVITLARDTKGLANGREIMAEIYDLQLNTGFIRIWSGEEKYFLSNNLKIDYENGNYKNETAGFLSKYNATMVVPIEHKNPKTGHQMIFGFLTVDSLNKGNHDSLFSIYDTKHIMSFGADLLALVMLNIEIFDKYESMQIEKSNET